VRRYRQVYEGLILLLKVAVCSGALSCTEPVAPAVRTTEHKISPPPVAVPVRNAEQKTSASPGAREQGESMFRVHYFRIGIMTLVAMTTEDVNKRGVVCFFKTPEEKAELTKILASAAPPTRPEHVFTDSTVRVKIVETNNDASEHVVAVIENTGVLRRDGVDQVLSPAAMDDLRRLIETRCKWPPP
jgi:hypothetical protein